MCLGFACSVLVDFVYVGFVFIVFMFVGFMFVDSAYVFVILPCIRCADRALPCPVLLSSLIVRSRFAVPQRARLPAHLVLSSNTLTIKLFINTIILFLRHFVKKCRHPAQALFFKIRTPISSRSAGIRHMEETGEKSRILALLPLLYQAAFRIYTEFRT